jgi:branched-chain amino acid transport system ATP-binding protein
MTLLETQNLGKNFGGLSAVTGFSIEVQAGVIFAIIGPNGAGKTTVINLLTGLLRPSSGRVILNGRDMTRAASHTVARAGVGRTFQNGRLFPRLTVTENILVGGNHRTPPGVLSAIIRAGRYAEADREVRERAASLTGELGLAEDANRPVGALPYGKQRMVEIARALVGRPRLLLLDEPAAGLNSGEAENLIHILDRLRGSGITMVLIEHNMGLVMRVADRIAVLNFGQKIAEGIPVEVRENPQVLQAYLGHGYKHAAV